MGMGRWKPLGSMGRWNGFEWVWFPSSHGEVWFGLVPNGTKPNHGIISKWEDGIGNLEEENLEGRFMSFEEAEKALSRLVSSRVLKGVSRLSCLGENQAR
ncbi:hypothetical protein R1flu_000593 [Riccia fluitans]|uniref:Uncharacterized protein n=1 Tax=Riccia fluitans TaxID=41844 RepID=A0ABD1Y131_9MARC